MKDAGGRTKGDSSKSSGPCRVEYTWVSEATQGAESIVLVTFEPHGGQTHVTLTQSNVPDDELGRRHEDGWNWVLSMWAERFATHG